MNQEIKKRIEQINKGIVPEGYKKTDFGIFPEDWVTDKTLGDLGKFGKGKGIPGDRLKESGVPCIGYGDIYMKYNYYFRKAQSFTDEKTALNSKSIEKGTLLFTGTGETPDEIGKCICYDGEETIYAGGDIITFVPNSVNSMFLAYQQYQSFSLSKKYAFGQGHSVVHIHKEELQKLPVAYPVSQNEQKKIAEILEKWDKAIELQEQYINMLTINKRSLINQLFKPRTKWLSIPMKDIFVVRSGYAFKSDTYVDDGRYYIITIANVKESEFVINKETATIDSVPSNIKDFQQLKRGDILMSLTGNVARVCKTEINNALLNQRVGKIEVKQSFDKEFVYYLLQTNKFVEYMKMFAQGAAQDNLSVKDVYRFRLTIPTEIDEQRKIRKVLQSIDSNISKQKQKIDLLKQQQKSLQQLLLNGIVRV